MFTYHTVVVHGVQIHRLNVYKYLFIYLSILVLCKRYKWTDVTLASPDMDYVTLTQTHSYTSLPGSNHVFGQCVAISGKI